MNEYTSDRLRREFGVDRTSLKRRGARLRTVNILSLAVGLPLLVYGAAAIAGVVAGPRSRAGVRAALTEAGSLMTGLLPSLVVVAALVGLLSVSWPALVWLTMFVVEVLGVARPDDLTRFGHSQLPQAARSWTLDRANGGLWAMLAIVVSTWIVGCLTSAAAAVRR